MAGEESPSEHRRSALTFLALGALASAVGIALGIAIDWFPTAASTAAGPIDTLWDVLVIVSVPIFVLVQGVVLYCVWRWRVRPGQEHQDGPPIHGNTRLEVVWTILPALLIFGLCVYAYIVLTDIEDARADAMRVEVVGQQFTWTFEYPQAGGEPVRSTQLYVPEGRQVHFIVRSKDVIHDFWVPAWRMKIDAVPGIATELRVTPTRRGRFPVVCAELCGLGHAFMRQTANVLPQASFDRWLKEQRAGGDEAGGDGEQSAEDVDGKAIFLEGTGQATACAACHTLADAGSKSDTGPNLDETLEGDSAEEIRRAIVEPSAEITEGFPPGIMPDNYDTALSDAELKALVDYLQEATK